MAQRILSLQVGSLLTLAAEVDYKAGRSKVYSSFAIETPQGLVKDGEITREQNVLDKFKETLDQALENHQIESKRVVFCVSSKRIAAREEDVPYLGDAKTKTYIDTNISEYFPVDLEQYQITYKFARKPVKGDQNAHILLYAVPNVIVKGYERLADVLGLDLVAVDCMGNTLAQTTREMAKNRNIATIAMGADETVLTVVANGEYKMQRSVNVGLGGAVEAIKEAMPEGSTVDDVIDRTRTENYFLNPAFGGTFGESTPLMEQLANGMENLSDSLVRIFEFYASKFPEINLDAIYIIGMNDQVKGLSAYISKQLGRPVRSYHEERVAAGFSADDSQFCVVAGAALDPVELKLESTASTGMDSGFGDSDDFGPAIRVMIIFIVLGICIIGYAVGMYFRAQNRQVSLNNTITTLTDAKNSYEKYLSTDAEYQEMVRINKLTDSKNDMMLAFLVELEQKLPTNAAVTSISAGDGDVSISFKASNKNVAANVLMQLRNFTTVLDANMAELEEDTSEDSLNEVTFTVTCNYAPITTDDEEEAEKVAADAIEESQKTETAEAAEGTETETTDATESSKTDSTTSTTADTTKTDSTSTTADTTKSTTTTAADTTKSTATTDTTKTTTDSTKSTTTADTTKSTSTTSTTGTTKSSTTTTTTKTDSTAKADTTKSSTSTASTSKSSTTTASTSKSSTSTTTETSEFKGIKLLNSDKKTVTTIGRLNIRTGPGQTYKAIGSYPNKTEVEVTGEYDNGWYRVDYNGQTAYIYSGYVK